MKMMKSCAATRIFQVMFSLLFLMLNGCAIPVHEAQLSTNALMGKGEPVQSQPGLSVVYIFKKYRNVDQVPRGAEALRMGRRGKPITILNHHSGKKESVFDSGRSQGVGMIMEGFLNLEKPGTYRWQAMANDGIRLFIDNKMIFEDPKVHSDRLTPIGTFQVDKSGRYPVEIIYFQRKGTAALKLYWQPPGEKEFRLVPAEVYLH